MKIVRHLIFAASFALVANSPAMAETGGPRTYWPKGEVDRFAMEVLLEFHTAELMNEYCSWVSVVEFRSETKYLRRWAAPFVIKHPRSYQDVLGTARNVAEIPRSSGGFNKTDYCEQNKSRLPALFSREGEFEEGAIGEGED